MVWVCDVYGRWCAFAMCDGLYYGGLSGMADSLHFVVVVGIG